MKIKLPKDLSGIKFQKILTIEMNNFDIDLFLPSLFFTILAQGHGKARQANNAKEIKRYIDNMAQHAALEGFSDLAGRRVLERLVRTALITTGGVGRASQGEQITSIVPYSLLAHRAGFPAENSRQRSVDTFIYQALHEKIQKDPQKADKKLLEVMEETFGRGVIIGRLPDLGGDYDGKTELDILTRLSIVFLDGLQNTKQGLKRDQSTPPACPKLANELATDLLRYLSEYHTRMPTQAFTHHLLALINFELFNYTLKLVYAINELVRKPDTLPAAMSDSLRSSPPQLFLDFTQDTHGRSYEMARACVRRDVEAYQQYFSSALRLRLLNGYVEQLGRNATRRAKIDAIFDGSTSGPLYLQRLLWLLNEPTLEMHMQAQARIDEERIRELNELQGEDVDVGEREESLSWLDSITSAADTDLERVVNLLVEGQRDNAINHFIAWYYGVGGIKKPHGVLRGNDSRQSWRYAPTNDLLAVFVQLAAARLPQPGTRSFRLQDFLTFLKERFGILIDRPPNTFQGAEYAAAARDNLRAMLNRLRQMGIFRDLSDDFTAQRLHPPYAGTQAVRMEA